jgi:hypothetical protein
MIVSHQEQEDREGDSSYSPEPDQFWIEKISYMVDDHAG